MKFITSLLMIMISLLYRDLNHLVIFMNVIELQSSLYQYLQILHHKFVHVFLFQVLIVLQHIFTFINRLIVLHRILYL